MTSRYRHRRTPLPATAFPSPIEPGEIVVNTANRQIAVGDAAAGTLGQPKPLIGVRFFDPTASYVLNDVVTQTGKVWRANGSIAPGAFNAANWTEIGAGGTAAGVASDPVGNVAATNVQAAIAELDAEKASKVYVDAADAALQAGVDGKVAKGGDTMAGPLVLPGAPTLDLQASTKKYVDDRIATVSAVYISDTAPAGAAANALWWESDSGLLYINYNDGNTTQWVIACPQPDTSVFVQKGGDTMTGPLTLAADPDVAMKAATKQYVDAGDAAAAANAVKYSAQSLTGAQQQQARQNIYAAPFDAMAYSGMQINGGMEVSQEKGTTGDGNNAAYICDGWRLYFTGSMVFGLAPVSSSSFPGYTNCLQTSFATAQASLGAGDFWLAKHLIEGTRCKRLQWGTATAQPITISFWSAHHRTGIFSGSVSNALGNRSYAFTYTQTAADLAQYNTVIIPGDTAGTWAVDNTIGMNVYFAVACGSTFIAPSANTWQAGNYLAAPGQVNGVAASTDVFRLTGVTVLPGNEAPSAARSPFIMRPYDQELLTCMRYWERPTGGYRMNIAAAGYSAVLIPHKVHKRAVPTAAFVSNGTVAGNSTFHAISGADTFGIWAQFTGTIGADSYNYGFTLTSDARL